MEEFILVSFKFQNIYIFIIVYVYVYIYIYNYIYMYIFIWFIDRFDTPKPKRNCDICGPVSNAKAGEDCITSEWLVWFDCCESKVIRSPNAKYPPMSNMASWEINKMEFSSWENRLHMVDFPVNHGLPEGVSPTCVKRHYVITTAATLGKWPDWPPAASQAGLDQHFIVIWLIWWKRNPFFFPLHLVYTCWSSCWYTPSFFCNQ